MPWALSITLLGYGLVLWRCPGLWLAVIPAVSPVVDLTPWTGWTPIGEPDLFVLVTIGVVALRAPPRRADFQLEGVVAAVLLLSLTSYLLSAALGLAFPGLEGGPGCTTHVVKSPVDLGLLDPVPGSTVEIGHIPMLDPQGRDIIFNGDFSRGTERWHFADDQHPVRLIEKLISDELVRERRVGSGLPDPATRNSALTGAVCSMGREELTAALVAVSLAGFLCSGVSDYVLGAPRLSALFHVVAFSGMTTMQTPMRGLAAPGVNLDRSGSRSDPPARPS